MDDNFIQVPQVMQLKGMSASDASKLALKSTGINLDDPYGVEQLSKKVEASLKSQGIEADATLVRSMAAQVLKSGMSGLVEKATDPVILPQPYVTPTDFSAQYPQPLDPTEILTLCEEITAWRVLPEVVTDYQADRLSVL